MKQREIKFRAWDKENEYMENPESWLLLVAQTGRVYRSSPIKAPYPAPEGQYILMQYTGLKDKRGKEIYEGDIVRFYQCKDKKGGAWLSLYKDYREWLGEIIFEEGEFRIGATKYIGKSNIEEREVGSWEVIGNIYENPNLLT